MTKKIIRNLAVMLLLSVSWVYAKVVCTCTASPGCTCSCTASPGNPNSCGCAESCP
jgi:hypothetical protein